MMSDADAWLTAKANPATQASGIINVLYFFMVLRCLLCFEMMIGQFGCLFDYECSQSYRCREATSDSTSNPQILPLRDRSGLLQTDFPRCPACTTGKIPSIPWWDILMHFWDIGRNGRNAECCPVKQGVGFTGQGKQRGGPRTTDHRSTDRWGGESSARRFWGPQMGAHVEWHAPTNSNQAGHADRPEGEQMEVWFANALTCYTMRCRRKNRIVLAPNGSSSSNAPAIIPADSWLWSD